MHIGILTGGGPAPGFNGVISAVVQAATARGWTVTGIRRGYQGLLDGDTVPLTPVDVEGIATRGGSVLGTSRANPTRDPDEMARCVATAKKLGLDALVTLGGDDTATTAAAIARDVGGGVRVAHVPKTIDNDLPLPGMAPTFGFETAKQVAAGLCRNLREDAKTTGRWYLVSAMGRSAGHLSLAMGMASGADLVVIREEYEDQGQVTLEEVATKVGRAIDVRREQGQDWGLVVLAEGLLEILDPEQLQKTVGDLELDEHGNPRMSEIDLGRIVRDVVAAEQENAGHRVKFVTKLIGYELRSADPCAFDVQYTRALGSGAVDFLADSDGDALITLQGDRIEPLRLEDLRDPETGRVPVRRVDLDGALWRTSLALQARDA